MELNKTTRWLYFLLGLWILFILSLGAWWTHLYLKFSDYTVVSTNPENFYRVTRMLKWEGITVFFGLLALSILIIYIFARDIKKSHSVRSFFATMTHEMKTPLASIKLQTEVLTDILKDIDPVNYKRIETYSNRLLEDGKKLEWEMDEILQLARLESGGTLTLDELSLQAELKKTTNNYPNFNFHIKILTQDLVWANSYALTLVTRNLIENTKRHQPNIKDIFITISNHDDRIILSYQDKGSPFKGDLNKLGKLFYKHLSEKGSGLGLYLINKLMKHMQGSIEIKQEEGLTFNLYFKKGQSE